MTSKPTDELIDELAYWLVTFEGRADRLPFSEYQIKANEIISKVRQHDSGNAWVSVSDRLPFPHRKMVLTFMTDGKVKMSYFSGDSFHEPWGDEYAGSKQPKWWMSLPSPPKTKE